MGLHIERTARKSYYLFVCEELIPGDYIRIEKDKIGYEYNRLVARDFVDAPMSVLILREELVEEIGGVEQVLNKIKQGEFTKRGNRIILD